MSVEEKVALMGVNERQVALAVLEHLRDDVLHANTADGCPIRDVSDVRAYLTEQIEKIRCNTMDVELGAVLVHASRPRDQS